MLKRAKNEQGSVVEAILMIAITMITLVVLVQFITNPNLRGNEEAGVEITKEVEKEVPAVENTVITEAFIEIIQGMGIAIGIIFVVGLLVFGIATFVHYSNEKERRGPQTLLEMLRFMNRKKPNGLFALVKGTAEKHDYYYEVGKHEWFLQASMDELDIKMNMERALVLHITYDKKTNSFVRRNLKADVFTDEKALKILDKFIARIVATEWQEHLSFNLISEAEEMSKEKPQPIPPDEHLIITNPMLELETHVENIIEDAVTKELFRSVIENMHVLREYHLELDIETKHIIEYSLTNDLNRLLSLYEELNEDQKETMAEEIQKRLHLMHEKVTEIKTKLDEKKSNEIKKALHLFDQRYQV